MNMQAYIAQSVVMPLCPSRHDAWDVAINDPICILSNLVVHSMSYTKEYVSMALSPKVPKTGDFCRESPQNR